MAMTVKSMGRHGNVPAFLFAAAIPSRAASD
jgi:hypothetical protein